MFAKCPGFCYHKGVLMTGFCSHEQCQLDIWSEFHQHVVPSTLRKYLTDLAQDAMSSNLGIYRTYKQFFSTLLI